MRRTVENELGEEYLTWPQREVFDKIGIRHFVMETDIYGNFILTGYNYGTARHWARLGQLYLQRGMWNGERLLPEEFLDFVQDPRPGVGGASLRRPLLAQHGGRGRTRKPHPNPAA